MPLALFRVEQTGRAPECAPPGPTGPSGHRRGPDRAAAGQVGRML